MHIILIDKDTESRLILASSLKRRSYHVDEFTTYSDANEKLCKDNTYLFLIDPQTLENSSYNDLGKFAKQFSQSPIIIISYDDSLQALENALQNDVLRYIIKPFDLTEVLDTIQVTESTTPHSTQENINY